MTEYTFPLGKCGSVSFSINEDDNLTLTAIYNGQTYALTFLDGVILENQRYARAESARTVSTLCGETDYTVQGDQLLAKAQVGEHITLFNRFTVSGEKAVITLQTWAESEGKI